MALFTRTAKLDPAAHGARCSSAMAVHHAVGISLQRNSGYRPSRVNIVARGLSTPDPSLSPTHLSIRRGRATTTHYTHHQVSLIVLRNTTLVPSLGLRIGPACEAGLSAGIRRERVSPQNKKATKKKEDSEFAKFLEQSGTHWDLAGSRSPHLNPGSLLVEASAVQGVICTWYWQRYELLECSLVTEWWCWRLISATLCGWRRCFDQLWLMTRIREEEELLMLWLDVFNTEQLRARYRGAKPCRHGKMSIAQGDHLSRKPQNVEEFDSCQESVWDFTRGKCPGENVR